MTNRVQFVSKFVSKLTSKVVSFFLLSLCATSALATPLFSPAPFIIHAEDKPMQSYLAMNLPYERYQQVLRIVERREGHPLKNRGEAHITVVTPLEYDNVLKPFLKIDQINAIAEKAGIQSTAFEEVCLGRGEAVLEGKPEQTYFMVVHSAGLLNLREMIKKAFIAAGGRADDFNAKLFYPHITIGFTARDLHLDDGVIKNEKSCIIH